MIDKRMKHFLDFHKEGLFPLLLIQFIGALGISIILPFLIYIIQDFGGGEVLYGLIAATYPFFQTIGSPLLGSLSDRVGRRNVLILTQGGTFVSWLVFLMAFFVPDQRLLEWQTVPLGAVGLSLPVFVLFLARALDGLTGGNISVANAYLADISDSGDRKANFGKMASASNLGFILGPAIAGMVSSLPSGRIITVLLAAGISLVGLLIVIFRLPRMEKEQSFNWRRIAQGMIGMLSKTWKKDRTKGIPGFPLKRKGVLRLPYVPYMILLFFIIYLSFNIFYATFPIHSAQGLNWESYQLGLFISTLSFVMIMVQGPLMSIISKQIEEFPLFIAGGLIMALVFAGLTLDQKWILYGVAVLFGLGNGIMWPSFLTMLAKKADKKRQGAVQGMAYGVGSLASIIGLAFGGVAYGLWGEWVFVLSVGCMAIVLVLGLHKKALTYSWPDSKGLE